MKKGIILIFILSCFIKKTEAQSDPTKQQTMDWIASKLKMYLRGERTFVSYAYGLFTYKKKTYDDNELFLGYATNVIDLNKVTKTNGYLSYGEGKCSGNLNFGGKDLGKVYTNKGTVESSDDYTISGEEDDEPPSICNINLDDTLLTRMIKALLNLIKFNSGSGIETF